MAEVRQITCERCHAPLPPEQFNSGALFACPTCGRRAQVEVFPAFRQAHFQASGGETLLIDAEASCFYHPQKKAAAVCDSCGRFLCGLCNIDLRGQHLCPACVESGRKKKKIKNLENERTLYDSMALLLALVPLLIWPATLLSAPATLYITVRHWNSPGGLVVRSKVRFVVAFLIALLQIIGWAVLFYFLAFHRL